MALSLEKFFFLRAGHFCSLHPLKNKAGFPFLINLLCVYLHFNVQISY